MPVKDLNQQLDMIRAALQQEPHISSIWLHARQKQLSKIIVEADNLESQDSLSIKARVMQLRILLDEKVRSQSRFKQPSSSRTSQASLTPAAVAAGNNSSPGGSAGGSRPASSKSKRASITPLSASWALALSCKSSDNFQPIGEGLNVAAAATTAAGPAKPAPKKVGAPVQPDSSKFSVHSLSGSDDTTSDTDTGTNTCTSTETGASRQASAELLVAASFQPLPKPSSSADSTTAVVNGARSQPVLQQPQPQSQSNIFQSPLRRRGKSTPPTPRRKGSINAPPESPPPAECCRFFHNCCQWSQPQSDAESAPLLGGDS